VGRSVAVGSGVFVFRMTTGSGEVGWTSTGAEQAFRNIIAKIKTKINFFI
jgi:hypothetical protein